MSRFPEPTRPTRICIASLVHELHYGVVPARDDLRDFFCDQDDCLSAAFCNGVTQAKARGFLDDRLRVTKKFCEHFGLELPERLQTRCKFCGKVWTCGKEYRVNKTGAVVRACYSCVYELRTWQPHRADWATEGAA